MPKRKTWDPEHMKAAVQAMRNEEMGSYKASRIFNVPQTTLERYAKKEEDPGEVIKTKMGRKPVLPGELESELASYCLEMEQKFFGLSRRDVRCMAYQLAKRNNLNNPFSDVNKQAGKKWLKNFMIRQKQLSVRTPQGLSYVRAKGFTQEAVSEFFGIYEPVLEKIKHSPSRVYNCDETGITVVQHKHTKVIGLKGKKQIGALQAAERGALITVVTCMNPAGHFIPPLIIFPRKNMKQELMDGTPLGSISACHPSGWIQSDLFTEWFKHFIKHVEPRPDNPAVLVLDGHFTHTRNIDVINLGRENHVDIVCLPPHSSHKMQPLDLSFMSPFKTYYAQEIETWLRNNADRGVVTIYQIGKLFGNAYKRAATAEIAAKGFEKAGLFPCNRHKFRPHDFLQTEAEQQPENSPVAPAGSGDLSLRCNTSPPDRTDFAPNPIETHAGPSSCQQQQVTCSSTVESQQSSQPLTPAARKFVGPSQISPVPRLNPGKKSNRSGAAQLITGSPYKSHLEASQSKNQKPKAICGKKRAAIPKPLKPTKPPKKVDDSDESSDDSDIDYGDSDDDPMSDEEQDAECIFCAGLFSDDHEGEDWIRCSKCFKWAHTLCANVGKRSCKDYKCEKCSAQNFPYKKIIKFT